MKKKTEKKSIAIANLIIQSPSFSKKNKPLNRYIVIFLLATHCKRKKSTNIFFWLGNKVQINN